MGKAGKGRPAISGVMALDDSDRVLAVSSKLHVMGWNSISPS